MTCMLIGFILIFFNIKISGFDLLPDFLGYLLIAMGIAFMPHKRPALSRAQMIALVLMVLSFLQNIPFVKLVFLIFFYMIYLILKGVSEIEMDAVCDLNSKNLFLWFKFLVAAQTALYLSAFAIESFFPMLTAILLFFMALNLAMCIMFLINLNRTRSLYKTLINHQS